MVTAERLTAFAGVAFGMAAMPGPNMLYVLSRSMAQGRSAGLVSLAGIMGGFVVYLACTVLGITALLLAVPHAFTGLRVAGALYLLWLAWGTLRGGGLALQPRPLAPQPAHRLFASGVLTNLLNPKAAVLYLSLLPQFIDPTAGSVLQQGLVLGLTQMAISFCVNGSVVWGAGGAAALLRARPAWVRVQRWVMASVFCGLALRLVVDRRAA